MLKFYKLDGQSVSVKSYVDEEGFTIWGADAANSPAGLVNAVPWLYRAVDLIGDRSSTMPFALVKGGADYDVSADWQNRIGFLPNPRRLIDVLARSLTVYGKAYLLNNRNTVRTLSLRYLQPETITPIIDPVRGLVGFERRINKGEMIRYQPEDIIYFWLPSEQVEIGPPPSSPVIAAAAAAGVLKASDDFAESYMSRGGVRVTILAVPGDTRKEERDKLKSWWDNVVSGVKNAFTAHVLNAEAVKPTVIGDGLEGIQNSSLTVQRREDICTALGIPQTLLFSNAANYATAQQDVLSFYDMTIVPLMELIAEALNEQLFHRYGVRMELRPETIDAFHEDEKDRAGAYASYVSSGMKPSVAAQICGIELPADMEYSELDDPEPAPPPAPVVVEEQQPEEQPETPPTPIQAEMRRWERKAINALKRGEPAQVEFISNVIPHLTAARIETELGRCKSIEDITAVFAYYAPQTDMVAIDQEVKDMETEKLDMLLAALKAIMEAPERKAASVASIDIPTVNVTLQVPPESIQVNVPPQPAPVVNVPAPVVNVAVPEQQAPVVNVTIPEQKAPVVKVEPVINVQSPAQPDAPVQLRVERDVNGRITGVKEV